MLSKTEEEIEFEKHLRENIVEILKIKFNNNQSKLSRAIKIGQPSVYKWISGKSTVSVFALRKICETTNISSDEIIFKKDEITKKINYELFNIVYNRVSLLLKRHNLNVQGTFFLGIYDIVFDKLLVDFSDNDINDKDITNIINQMEKTIVKLAK